MALSKFPRDFDLGDRLHLATNRFDLYFGEQAPKLPLEPKAADDSGDMPWRPFRHFHACMHLGLHLEFANSPCDGQMIILTKTNKVIYIPWKDYESLVIFVWRIQMDCEKDKLPFIGAGFGMSFETFTIHADVPRNCDRWEVVEITQKTKDHQFTMEITRSEFMEFMNAYRHLLTIDKSVTQCKMLELNYDDYVECKFCRELKRQEVELTPTEPSIGGVAQELFKCSLD